MTQKNCCYSEVITCYLNLLINGPKVRRKGQEYSLKCTSTSRKPFRLCIASDVYTTKNIPRMWLLQSLHCGSTGLLISGINHSTQYLQRYMPTMTKTRIISITEAQMHLPNLSMLKSKRTGQPREGSGISISSFLDSLKFMPEFIHSTYFSI